MHLLALIRLSSSTLESGRISSDGNDRFIIRALVANDSPSLSFPRQLSLSSEQMSTFQSNKARACVLRGQNHQRLQEAVELVSLALSCDLCAANRFDLPEQSCLSVNEILIEHVHTTCMLTTEARSFSCCHNAVAAARKCSPRMSGLSGVAYATSVSENSFGSTSTVGGTELHHFELPDALARIALNNKYEQNCDSLFRLRIAWRNKSSSTNLHIGLRIARKSEMR